MPPHPPMTGNERLDKVTGRAVFASDIAVPGMAHGRILRSPLPHANIARLDCTSALALDGVVAVLTGEALPTSFGKTRHSGESGIPAHDGNLGLVVLERFHTRIDYPGGRLILEPGGDLVVAAIDTDETHAGARLGGDQPEPDAIPGMECNSLHFNGFSDGLAIQHRHVGSNGDRNDVASRHSSLNF